tara:strand:- start:56 stop:1933 length:1878 start_codon:yes stop_codon:yes gene_type:complete
MSNVMMDDKERVREAVDLVELISDYIPVQAKGQEWVCVCPFHDDHKPSMCIVTHRERAFYKCFSCDESGDCFSFLQKFLNIGFVDALKMLAERTGIELTNRTPQDKDAQSKRDKLRKAVSWSMEQYKGALSNDEAVCSTLAERGINKESIETFSIGFAPEAWTFLADKLWNASDRIETASDAGLLKKKAGTNRVYDAFRNRIIFPIHDDTGNPIAFGGRRINEEDEPKYINSPETEIFHKSKTLYGFDLARRAMQTENKVIVVEGYTDVIACHQVGVKNVVATLGTSLTPQHAQKLSRMCEEVILVFDGDEAGQRAADRAVEIFFAKEIDVSICVLPEGKDPADVATDAESLREHFAAAVDAIAYKFTRIEAKLKNTDTISGRTKMVATFLDELIRLGIAKLPGIKKPLVHERIARLLKIPMEQVQSHLQARAQSSPPRRVHKVETPENAYKEEMPLLQEEERDDLPVVPVPRNRKLAECEFLSVLLYGPTQASAILRESDEAIGAELFIDTSACLIAKCIFPKLYAGTSYTIPEVQDEVSVVSIEAKNLAASLYFEGVRLCEEAGSIDLAVNQTKTAFLQTISNKAIADNVQEIKNFTDPNQQAKAAQDALEAIRNNQKKKHAK